MHLWAWLAACAAGWLICAVAAVAIEAYRLYSGRTFLRRALSAQLSIADFGVDFRRPDKRIANENRASTDRASGSKVSIDFSLTMPAELLTARTSPPRTPAADP